MGLANRVVDDGASREEAEKLAAEIAAFPNVCMRHDRLSALEQFDLSLADALRNEFDHGLTALKGPEILEGVRSFAGGKGRHGSFGKQ